MLNTEKPSSFKDYAINSHVPYLDEYGSSKFLLCNDQDNIRRYIEFDELLRKISQNGYDYEMENKKLFRFLGEKKFISNLLQS